MEKRLNNSHYVVFGLVLLVLVMGVINVVRSDAVVQGNVVGHSLSQVVNTRGISVDADNDGIIDLSKGLALRNVGDNSISNEKLVGWKAVERGDDVVFLQSDASNPVRVDSAINADRASVANRADISTKWPDGSDYCILVYVGVGSTNSRPCPAEFRDNGFVDIAMSGYVVTSHDPESGYDTTSPVVVNSIGLKLEGQGDSMNTKFKPKLCCKAEGGFEP